MIWVPITLGLIKVVAIGTTIFFAIKSHRDGEKGQDDNGGAGARPETVDRSVEPS